MKYFSFLLVICFGLAVSACQNQQSTEVGASSEEGGSSNAPNSQIVVSNVKPAGEKNSLNEQVATDLLAAYALERTVKPAYDESMALMKSIRSQVDLTNEAERMRVMPMLEGAQKLRNSFEEHQRYSLQLDSLTFKIAGGKLSIEEAQRQYLENRNALKAIESRLAGELEQVKQLKTAVGGGN